MDETLIHCVDDIDAEDPDVVLPIDFPDEEETVNVLSSRDSLGGRQSEALPLRMLGRSR